MILTHLVDISKLTNDADADKEGYETTPSIRNLSVNIQPADAETIAISEGAFGKTFKMFAPTTASGVARGDKVTVISGNVIGDTYIIQGDENWNMGGPLPHYEYVIFKSNE